MEILLWGREEPDEASTVERLERDLADRFGRDEVRRDPEGTNPDVVLVAFRTGDVHPPRPGLEAAIGRARERAVPLFVLPLDGAAIPAADRLPSTLRPLAEAPEVAPDELLEVLGFVADPARSRLPAAPRPPSRRASDRPSAVARIRRDLARRDPILLKIAGTSTAVGLALLATVGWGGASLFLFLGGVSFLISKQSD